MKKAIKIGLVIGVISIIISLFITKVISAEIMFSAKSILISMLTTIVLLVVLGKLWLFDDERVSLSYGEALKELFVASMVAGIVSLVASVALYQNDEAMQDAFHKYSISTQESSFAMGMKMAGASEIRIEEELEQLREKRASGEMPPQDYPMSWSNIPMNLFMQIFMSLIYALIAAIFVKKNTSPMGA